jgi:hypothetical protein
MDDLTKISKGKWIVDDCGTIAEVGEQFWPGDDIGPGATLMIFPSYQIAVLIVSNEPWKKMGHGIFFHCRVTRPALMRANWSGGDDDRRHAVIEIHDEKPDHRAPINRKGSNNDCI